MHCAAIALGSNLPSRFGDRDANLREAISRIGTLGTVRAVSSFYDTAPVGYADQGRFLNAALLLETEVEPVALLHALLGVELAIGRDRSGAGVANGPRVIDADLLLVDDLTLDIPGLILPHPEMHRRRFVLEPLAEIAPDMVHPAIRLRIAELLAGLRE